MDRLVAAFSDRDSEAGCDDVTSVDWYFMPMVNPDGYEFSHEEDRMWRKNRAAPPKGMNDTSPGIVCVCNMIFSAGSKCYGVDLNRNFNVVGFGIGASSDPCQEIYQGAKRNSEPEVRTVSEALLEHNNTIRVALTLHSYGTVSMQSMQ